MTKSKCDKNLLVQGHRIHLEGEPITKKKKGWNKFYSILHAGSILVM